MTSNTFDTNCPKCDTWNVRLISAEQKEVENEYTGELEMRTVLFYECRECPTEWKEYE